MRLTNILSKTPFFDHFEVLFYSELLSFDFFFSIFYGQFSESFFFSNPLFLIINLLLFISYSLSFEISSPFDNLWLFVDTNGISVGWKDFLEFWVVEDLLSGWHSESVRSFLEVNISWIVMSFGGTICVFTSLPEGLESDDDLVDLPSWVPWLWVIVWDWEADTVLLFVGSESSIVDDKIDFWSLGWIFRWASDVSHIVATSVIVHIEVKDDVPPLEGIFWIW